jgi:hypothetical protein
VPPLGYLSYRHVRRELVPDRQHISSRLTRQMASMALFQIINVLAFTIPFTVTQAYFLGRANSVKDAYQQAQEQFAQLFFNVFLAGLYGVRFVHSVVYKKL